MLASDTRKQSIAQNLVARALAGEGGISWPVVQEFGNVALGKMKSGFPPGTLAEYQRRVLIPLCKVYPDARIDSETLLVAQNMGNSWYDSLIVAAAGRMGCPCLDSEDLQDVRTFGEMRIVSPFLS